jgi:lysophospholipase L1-like esterase
MKFARFVSSNFLERVAEPESPFHRDYLAYRMGEITRTQLMARLPHVAMLGDSVCMGIYISSAWRTLWLAHRSGGQNWFFNLDNNASSVRSISKRLDEITPFVASEYAGIGALVDDEHERLNVFRHILGTRNFSGQIREVLRAARFPDLILIAIGHNNVDWAWRCPPIEFDRPEQRLLRLSKQFQRNYSRNLRRLLDGARIQRHRVAIVVYGLINFQSYFQGREAAERLRRSDSNLYPYLESTYKHFISFHPEYRRNLVRLAAMANEELRAMVDDLNSEFLHRDEHIQLRYSHALTTADLSRAELLHPIDGWHASVEGHNVLAEAASNDLEPSLNFLGIG